MSRQHRLVSALAGAVGIAVLAGTFAGAQELAPVLVLIDKDSITHGQPPNGFTTQDVNEELAAVGMRDNLPYFKRNAGKSVTLVTGRGSNDGWHTLAAVPPTWATEPGENDGLENFVLAGPGLGSPDANGARTSLLMGAIVKGLRGSDLTALQGRSVCAVVFQSDLGATTLPVDLNGPTIGIIALKIVSVSASSDASGIVEATILDAADVCQGALALPGSSGS